MSTLTVVSPRHEGDPPPRTILLLDPHPDSRIVYSTILAHHGLHVLEAADAASGLRLMREARVRLAVVEFETRLRRPCDLGARLRAAAGGEPPVLLVVSAWALPDEREAALASGFDAFYAKPIYPSHLLGEVRRWLGTPTPVLA